MTNEEREWNNYKSITSQEIARCSKCNTPFFGCEIDARHFLGIDRSRAIHCSKCNHLDPAFDKRTYGIYIKNYQTTSFDFVSDKNRLPWWTKKVPLWAI